MSDYKEIIVKEYHNEKGLLTRREIGEEIVRCGKCKFHDPNWSSCTYWFDNPFDQQTVKDDDYCSFGKLKEE